MNLLFLAPGTPFDEVGPYLLARPGTVRSIDTLDLSDTFFKEKHVKHDEEQSWRSWAFGRKVSFTLYRTHQYSSSSLREYLRVSDRCSLTLQRYTSRRSCSDRCHGFNVQISVGSKVQSSS